MTKKDMIKIMKLLSGLESLMMFSSKEAVPDYLSDDIAWAVAKLEAEILKPDQEAQK